MLLYANPDLKDPEPDNYETGPGFSESGSDPDSAPSAVRLHKRPWIPSGTVAINQAETA